MPFDMVVLNETSRYHLAIEALRRAKCVLLNAELLVDECNAFLKQQAAYVRARAFRGHATTQWSRTS